MGNNGAKLQPQIIQLVNKSRTDLVMVRLCSFIFISCHSLLCIHGFSSELYMMHLYLLFVHFVLLNSFFFLLFLFLVYCNFLLFCCTDCLCFHCLVLGSCFLFFVFYVVQLYDYCVLISLSFCWFHCTPPPLFFFLSFFFSSLSSFSMQWGFVVGAFCLQKIYYFSVLGHS